MRVEKGQLLNEIRIAGGNLSAVARKCGVTRQAVAKRVASSEVLKAALIEATNELLDVAEDGLRLAVTRQDPWAIRFVLSTKGAGRGFSRTVKVESDEKPGVMHLYFPDDGRDKPDPSNPEPTPTGTGADDAKVGP
jgi:hypothetical protein